MREHISVSIGRSECDFVCLSDSLYVCLPLRAHRCTPAVHVSCEYATLREGVALPSPSLTAEKPHLQLVEGFDSTHGMN